MEALTYRATVVGFSGQVLRVYDVPADDVSPPAWLFCLVYRMPAGDFPTGAKLKLWPSDLIRPVRSALEVKADVDLRHWKRDERDRKRKEKERAKVFVEGSDENDDLARELGIL